MGATPCAKRDASNCRLTNSLGDDISLELDNSDGHLPTTGDETSGCDDTAETLYPDRRYSANVIARVVKLVDTRHLKCLAGETGMPVRSRPRAPECGPAGATRESERAIVLIESKSKLPKRTRPVRATRVRGLSLSPNRCTCLKRGIHHHPFPTRSPRPQQQRQTRSRRTNVCQRVTDPGHWT